MPLLLYQKQLARKKFKENINETCLALETDPGVHVNCNGLLVALDSSLPASSLKKILIDREDYLYPCNFIILSVLPVANSFKFKDKVHSTRSLCRLLFTNDRVNPTFLEMTKSHIVPRVDFDQDTWLEAISQSAKSLPFVQDIKFHKLDLSHLSESWPSYKNAQAVEIMLQSTYDANNSSLLSNFEQVFRLSPMKVFTNALVPYSIHLMDYQIKCD